MWYDLTPKKEAEAERAQRRKERWLVLSGALAPVVAALILVGGRLLGFNPEGVAYVASVTGGVILCGQAVIVFWWVLKVYF